jgi:hypothetical protein
MLHQESKLLVILCLITFFASCSRYKKYDAKEITDIRNNAVTMSKSLIGENSYNLIYNNLNDSIHNWIENQIDYIKYYNEEREWVIDSVMCINSNGNKLVTSVLKRSMYDNSNTDFIDYFYGVRIKREWYFFRGAGMVLPREYYQKDIHTPLSFEKLKQIAASNIYRRYLVKNKKGEWEINDRFFDDLTSGAWCSDCVTQEQWDSAYIRQINRNWSKRDKK